MGTSARARAADTVGDGWISFAAIMAAIAGTVAVIDGIVGLTRSKFFTQNAVYVFSDLRTWSWIVLILGVIQLIAAASLGSGQQWARWFTVATAAIGSIGQLAWVPAYPFWALAMFTVDILVIYALVCYGGRDRGL